MRRFLLSLTALAVMLLLGVISLSWMNENMNKMKNELTEAQNAPKDEALDILTDVQERWKESRAVYSIFLRDRVLDELDSHFSAIKVTRGRDQLDEFYLNTAALIAHIERVIESELPSWHNIL